MPKECTLFTVIDFDGLANYYDKTTKLPTYNADSFYNIICDDALYVGPTNQVLLFEEDVVYTWQMNALSNLDPSTTYIIPVVTNFEFTWLGNTPVNWNDVFDVDNSEFEEFGNTLVCKNFGTTAATSIRTRKALFTNEPNLRLSYSIQFEFQIGQITYTGIIDPIIKNRTGED